MESPDRRHRGVAVNALIEQRGMSERGCDDDNDNEGGFDERNQEEKG